MPIQPTLSATSTTTLPVLHLVGANAAPPTVTITQEQFDRLIAAAGARESAPTWRDTFVRVGARAGEVTLQAVVAGAVSGAVGGVVAVGATHLMHALPTPRLVAPRVHALQAFHPGELQPPPPWMEPIPQPAPDHAVLERAQQAANTATGGMIGTAIGGALGTVVPGLGNVIGATVGGVVGGIIGSLF